MRWQAILLTAVGTRFYIVIQLPVLISALSVQKFFRTDVVEPQGEVEFPVTFGANRSPGMLRNLAFINSLKKKAMWAFDQHWK